MITQWRDDQIFVNWDSVIVAWEAVTAGWESVLAGWETRLHSIGGWKICLAGESILWG
jgi:hypothetical protein